MDGIHDLGGMHGFGRVPVADGEPRFHAAWEGRVAGITIRLLSLGYFNIDAFRHAIENLDPVDYLSWPYFARWRHSVEANLVAAGWLSRDELETRLRELEAGARPRSRGQLPRRLEPQPPPAGFARELDRAARFRVGSIVRARDLHPAGHTRLPRYARGRRGRVERVHGAFVFPDSHAHGLGEQPQHLYSVRFDASELWGGDAEPGTCVALDLFESYLETDGTPA